MHVYCLQQFLKHHLMACYHSMKYERSQESQSQLSFCFRVGQIHCGPNIERRHLSAHSLNKLLQLRPIHQSVQRLQLVRLSRLLNYFPTVCIDFRPSTSRFQTSLQHIRAKDQLQLSIHHSLSQKRLQVLSDQKMIHFQFDRMHRYPNTSRQPQSSMRKSKHSPLQLLLHH